MAATYRIQKKLGGLETKLAINHIVEKDIKAAFHILLSYYDKLYEKEKNLTHIESNKVDPIENAKLIQTCINS